MTFTDGNFVLVVMRSFLSFPWRVSFPWSVSRFLFRVESPVGVPVGVFVGIEFPVGDASYDIDR